MKSLAEDSCVGDFFMQPVGPAAVQLCFCSTSRR
jgi:hypothetical protein